MTVATDRSKAFFTIYNKGLQDEALVKSHLTNTGRIVTPSTMEEDKFQDIDCYCQGIPTSIKSQHAGATYGNIGFELSQHLTAYQDCATSKSILANKDLTLNDIERLEKTGNWEKSWFYNGKAEQYYIYIGEVVRCYQKQDIVAHIEKHGYKRIRALKASTKATQGDRYRYCNAISGYLDINAVKHTKEMINKWELN